MFLPFRRTSVRVSPAASSSRWTQSMHSYCVSRAAEHTPAPGNGRAGRRGAELYCTTRQRDERAAATVGPSQFGFDVRLKLFGAPRVVKLSRIERSVDVGAASRCVESFRQQMLHPLSLCGPNCPLPLCLPLSPPSLCRLRKVHSC